MLATQLLTAERLPVEPDSIHDDFRKWIHPNHLKYPDIKHVMAWKERKGDGIGRITVRSGTRCPVALEAVRSQSSPTRTSELYLNRTAGPALCRGSRIAMMTKLSLAPQRNARFHFTCL